MIFRSGEIIERRAVRCRGNHAQIDIDPGLNFTDDFVSPCAITFTTSGIAMKKSITGFGSFETARISTSPIVSFRRRAEPAIVTRRTFSFRSCNRFSISRISAISNPSTNRPPEDFAKPMLFQNIFLFFFAKSFELRDLSRFRRRFKLGDGANIQFLVQRLDRFRSEPSIRDNPSRSTGVFRSRPSKYFTWPVLTSSSIFSAMEMPTPGISSSAFLPAVFINVRDLILKSRDHARRFFIRPRLEGDIFHRKMLADLAEHVRDIFI